VSLAAGSLSLFSRRVDSRIFGLALTALACLAFAIWRFPSPIDGNGDTAWLIIVAGRVLDGAKLYADVFETNPPMSVMLYIPAVATARLLGGAAEWWLLAQCLAMAAVALALFARLLPVCGIDRLSDQMLLLGVAAFALVLLPSRSFAQREHVAAICLLPALALLAARDRAERKPALLVQLAAGLLSGLALCIKPHFALCLVLPHLALLARDLRDQGAAAALVRRFAQVVNGEHFTTGLVAGSYLAAVLLCFSAFREVMMERVALLYLPDRLTMPELLSAPAMALMIVLGILTVMLRLPRPSGLGLVLAAAACGCAAAFIIQGKGWAYQMLPGICLGVIGFAALAIGSVRAGAGQPPVRDARLVLAAALIVGGVLAPQVFSRYETPRQVEAILSRHVERPTVLAATVSLEVLPMIRRLGGEWAGRSASLWMTNTGSAQFVAGDSSPRQERIRALMRLDRDLFVEDAIGKRPDVLLFAAPNPDQDFLIWASGDVRMLPFLAGYHEIGRADAMRVLVRNDLLTRSLRLTRLDP
jgi:hypothetical protein